MATKKKKSAFPTFRVETEYSNGLKTSNEVQCKQGFDAVNQALDTDRKVHGKKVDACTKAVHKIFSDGKQLQPEVETIFA